ncbi:DegT/DnrJ/EryC1/StrS family aminotransferase [Dictyoglomus thermophilum]|uniref:UDP-4-amino-4-deoxy-L-arabinose--oxoglutarate aminotransferase (UDP-(Beta-L-threo-pentapyranosyl-4''-ulose diphosphate)aminotransferase) n=1 Tax=Dictyoglomus thermophilum (strain ATCC 35947 / DSM 3960 / H-6-12) TaxID=309799 RepID=B5YCR4_DICT6|nr:DegT/DnrJ/EryC1/StrS aminotransferase family protein [Dictyoglomus thermophilum]ACI18597.1 UDP-4-amino-4-deoxy-L-arabinose--oxoglutarate aminotransferase (UDP-(beta-L-threo-pentapyranosyl-4''-ulose diphosphate)aminotransferase) [Dictyoglomus thermophilum H-6-12]TYT23352.1 DegT/DnrJ/EryC1/StrS aminotransferase family protein [Dictyoglomus thermophilum]
MRNKFIPFSPPWIGEEEINEVVDTLKSDWITTGPKVKKFEEEFCRYFNSPSALALNSCTAALHTALVTLGIGPGDEVITTPMTFCASVNVIEHVGAKPVLVDVESDTLNIDPNKIESAITNKTKAILPVHYSGHPVELDTIYDIAEKYNLYVVEDAAHAIHAKYKGRFIGSSNNPVCFSFYATKNLTTAEGGMLTGDPNFIERARIISLHGMSKDAWKRYSKEGSWYYEVVYPGFKYNMTDIQASIGLWQLNKLENFQRRRREIVNMYNSAFKDIEALRTPIERPEVEHSWHLYVLRLNLEMLRIDRNQFIEELKNRNIGTSVHFIPIHLHPYYRDKYGFKPNDFPVAYENYLKIISLPLYPRMSNEDVYDVIEAVIDVVKKYRR